VPRSSVFVGWNPIQGRPPSLGNVLEGVDDATLTVPIPPRPDIAPPTPEARWHRSGLEIALAAPLGWLGGSWVAWRSLGWYPLSSAKVFFVVGWVLVLFLGLTVGRSALRRRTVGALLLAIAFATPVLAAHHLPGVKQPTQYPIPGRPWLAVSAAPDGASDLYLMKGDADHLLSFGETPWTEGSAALSPDHRHVAFASNRYGSYDLFVMDLDASGNRIRTRRLTNGPGDESETAWSPDGRKIVYTVRRGGSSTIHVIEASGGTPRELAGSAVNPEWSPDGHWIAYSAPDPSNRTDYDIWVMRPDGSHPRDVIDATPTDWSPRWSPDGSRIAFTGGRDDHWGVYLADTNGARVQGVMGDSETNEAFGWSPDGSKILFLSDRSHGRNVSLLHGPRRNQRSARPQALRHRTHMQVADPEARPREGRHQGSLGAVRGERISSWSGLPEPAPAWLRSPLRTAGPALGTGIA
jgi:dipeptidyl aminopeptidase/acylaminoacyl peptidase